LELSVFFAIMQHTVAVLSTYIPLLWLVVALGLAGLLLAGVYLYRIILRRKSRWQMVKVQGDFVIEHHLPDELPVPSEHVSRANRGEFSLEEAINWIRDFIKQNKRHPHRQQWQLVLKKYNYYRELAHKMRRGLWHDVDQLARRLAELDPLDPSAAVAQGRAKRELGDFPRAISHYQRALELTPFHSAAFPELAATCRAIGQPGRFRRALEKARQELGELHPLTLEGRIQLGELVRVYADPTDPATLAHVPREHYLLNLRHTLDEMSLDTSGFLLVGQNMLEDDLPELADLLAQRCEQERGECAESKLLKGMVAYYRLNYEKAEQFIHQSLEMEDTAMARLELARAISAKAHQVEMRQTQLLLQAQAEQQLRLAIDRDPNLIDAIVMLVEPSWSRGLPGVKQQVLSLIEAYPEAWGPWRVLGDAHAVEAEYANAVDCYKRGLAQEKRDELFLPCLEAMEDGNMRKEAVELVRHIDHLEKRDPQLRWRAAHVLCESQLPRRARRLLQSLVDDEHVAPQMRQRADDVLDELDEMERKKGRRKST